MLKCKLFGKINNMASFETLFSLIGKRKAYFSLPKAI
jgi:hypothetical protein